MTVEKIEQKIKDLELERDNYLQQVNQQLAAYNGAIQALKQLLEEDNQEEEE